MRTPQEIISQAMDKYPVRRTFVGFSGGRDSFAVTHWMMTHVPGCEVFHCNTGIGIERTRVFVRQICQEYGWPLHEIRAKEDCGQDYDDMVRLYGFPGPGMHSRMYARLKERAIRKLVRDSKQHRTDKILIATGIRHDESVRRMRYVGREINQTGAQLWCNPIYWWSSSDRDSYLAEHDLPVNPVSQMLGMSGECLCGAFAHKGVKALIRLVCPETADRIDALEVMAAENGHHWKWEEGPGDAVDPNQTDMFGIDESDFMPMCVGCEK